MSFASETRQRSMPVLPLAAFVDILFLLLAFLLTTSAMRERELQIGVDLPSADTGEGAVSPALQTIVTISTEDRLFLGDQELAMPQLRQKLKDLAAAQASDSVVVRGDQGSSFGLAVQVMDAAQQAGIRDVSVATVKSVEEIQ